MGSPSCIAVGDVVSLADFPGGDRPRSLEYRHSRHVDAYSGETPGYPELEFEATEPLAWQEVRPGGPWRTRIRSRGGGEYLEAHMVSACGENCKRRKSKAKQKRASSCTCPRQLHVTLSGRSGHPHKEVYARICGWVKDGMEPSGRLFTRDAWLRRSGPDRVVVHHENAPLEHDAEDAVVFVKDDTTFAGLEPCTPAQHEVRHTVMRAAQAAAEVEAAAEAAEPVPAPAPAVVIQDPMIAHREAVIAEGVPRGRPPKRRRGRGRGGR